MMPLVSIIIPAYNQAQYVAQTVDSALAQTYPNVEVIVVNDGSTDDTAAILAGYRGRIKCISQANRGLAGARNAGFSVARGEYLLFLDSDDIIPPTKIARHLEWFDQQPDVGVVYSGWQYIDSNGNPLPGETRLRQEGQMLSRLLLSKFYCIPGAAVIKRQILEQAGLFDESLRAEEDTDLWIRAAQAGCKFGYIDELLLHYRLHPASLSAQADHQVKHAFARLDKFFTNDSLTSEIKQLKSQAYSAAHFVAAGRYYRVGNIESGCSHLSQALAIYQPLATDKNKLMQKISSMVLSTKHNDPLAVLDILFSTPDLPPAIKSVQPEASTLVYLVLAADHYFAGQAEQALNLLQRAPLRTAPTTVDWLLDWIASTALTAPAESGCQFIDWISDSLPVDLPTFKGRAYGRYHVASVFLAHQNQQPREMRRHILPAVWGHPAIIKNRGFISVVLRSLFA